MACSGHGVGTKVEVCAVWAAELELDLNSPIHWHSLECPMPSSTNHITLFIERPNTHLSHQQLDDRIV
jgi:hypothetical protein